MSPTATAPDAVRPKYRLPVLAPDGQTVTVDLSTVPTDRRAEVVHAITTIIAVVWAEADEKLIADVWAAAAEAESSLSVPLADIPAHLRAKSK